MTWDYATACMATAYLEDTQPSPLPPLVDAAEEYDQWAATAAPLELEAMMSAVARYLPDTPLHQRARKRIIAALWRGMSADDRTAFQEWVKREG